MDTLTAGGTQQTNAPDFFIVFFLAVRLELFIFAVFNFNFWNYEEIFLFDGGVVGGADGAGAGGNRNLASNYC